MFDYYQPAGEPRCPWCGARLPAWQGKGSHCMLLVYREGELAPVEHRVDEDARVAAADLPRFALERPVEIYSYDCAHAPVIAIAEVRERVWCETIFLPVR